MLRYIIWVLVGSAIKTKNISSKWILKWRSVDCRVRGVDFYIYLKSKYCQLVLDGYCQSEKLLEFFWGSFGLIFGSKSVFFGNIMFIFMFDVFWRFFLLALVNFSTLKLTKPVSAWQIRFFKKSFFQNVACISKCLPIPSNIEQLRKSTPPSEEQEWHRLGHVARITEMVSQGLEVILREDPEVISRGS